MSESWKQWEGQVVDGKFPLREYLGGSESSAVFLTERGGTKAAIKFIQVNEADAEQQLSRWKAATHLFHVHLLRVFDSGRCRLGEYDVLYVVTECAQENLGQFLSQRPLTPAETRDVLEPVLDALAYLHREGFVHGHIRPSNVFAIDDEVKLSSDGLSMITEFSGKPVDSGQEVLQDTTRSEAQHSTAYDSPEAARGEISPANDVWSLGMTLVEILTQRLPVPADAGSSVRPGDPAVPETLPALYLDIARHCLQREPHRRWTVAEIAARLNPASAAATAGIAAKPVPTAAAPPRVSHAAASHEERYQIPATARPPLHSQAAAPRDHYTKPRYDLSPPRLKRPPLLPKANYFILGFVGTLVLLAMIILPRLFGHRASTEQASSVEPAAPATQKTPPASVHAKTQPKSAQKAPVATATLPAATASSRTPSANAKPAMNSSPKESARASVAAPAPAALRSTAAPSTPVTTNVDAKSSDAVAKGEVLDQILPDVSQKAQATIRGTVRTSVKLHVDAAGNVTGAELFSTGPSKYFADLALNAARRWDFAPAKRDGHNVPSDWLVRFEFTQTATRVFPTQATP